MYLEVRILKYNVLLYIRTIFTNKPSDKVVAYLVTLGPIMPTELLHCIRKAYCFPGLKSMTFSCELLVSILNSFSLSEWYVTIYLTGPTLAPVHPLKVSVTDRAVMVLPLIDTLGLVGTVWRC